MCIWRYILSTIRKEVQFAVSIMLNPSSVSIAEYKIAAPDMCILWLIYPRTIIAIAYRILLPGLSVNNSISFIY